MALHYITAQDAHEHLQKDTYPVPDYDKMNALCEAQEDWFDNQLRRRFTVPFDASDNTEAYELAQEIVSRRAAADYIEWDNQVQGTPEQMWYADKLRETADIMMKPFYLQQEPEDADLSADPILLLPSDGLQDGERPAIFKIAQVTPGNSAHW